MLGLLAGAVLSLTSRYVSRPPSGTTFSRNVWQGQERLRTILPNSAVVYVEQTPSDGRLTLQLFVSGRSSPDTLITNGYRHLWEHLVAKGRTRSLDRELESHGAFLTAQTYRDATVFQIVLKPTDLKLGLAAVHALTQLGELSAADISKESAIINQEIALESTSREFIQQAWKIAYGDGGLDPLGDPDIIAAATPYAIQRLHQSLMTGRNITLLIAGDVDLDSTTQDARDALVTMPAGADGQPVIRRFQGGLSSYGFVGGALAVPVSSWNVPSTAARLAAGLAIAASLKQSFVSYTPSLEGSLIVVGDVNDSASISRAIAKMDPVGLFGLGRSLAHHWVNKEDSISQDGILTGLLISEGAGQRIQTLYDNLDRMTQAEFTAAFHAYLSKDAVEVLGK